MNREHFRRELARHKKEYSWYLAALEWPFDTTGTHPGAWYMARHLTLLLGLAYLDTEKKNLHRIRKRTDYHTLDVIAGDFDVDVASVATGWYEPLWEGLAGRMEPFAPGLHEIITGSVKGRELFDDDDVQMCFLGLTLFFQAVAEDCEAMTQAFEELGQRLRKPPV